MKTKEVGHYKWLAIAREALIRAGASPSEADCAIEVDIYEYRDANDFHDWAFHLCEDLACRHTVLDVNED